MYLFMKKQFLVLAAVAATVVTTIVAISCKRNLDHQENFTPRATAAGNHLPTGLPVTVLKDTVLRANKTLTNDRIWVLDGKVYVDDGATLNIEEGTFVAGKKKSTNDSASALIITRGCKIHARGTADNPVVFTSYESCPQAGDWGGVVLLGDAPLNRNDTTIEGINTPSVPAGVDINYGGGGPCTGDAIDSSGVIQFTRIEYAGAQIAANNELNGLTLGGVGSRTVLDHIEVAYGNDDAFEFFGGTVNARYLIALVPDDDAFDFDFGYIGNIQFAVSILKPGNDFFGVPMNYSSNPNGIESSSAPGGAATCQATQPRISNMTVVGYCTNSTTQPILNGATFNTASSQIVRNSVFMGFPTGVNFTGGVNNDFQYNTVQAFTTVDVGSSLNATNREIVSASANSALINLLDPCDACTPDFKPAAGSTLLTDTKNYTGLSSFHVVKTYRGACAASGADGTWPNASWVKYNYPRFCANCN
jgi:hypothetical protein